MLWIFNKKDPHDGLEWLAVDMHSHLLSGIGKDSLDLETAVSYIRQLNELGVGKIYCTPPIEENSPANSSEAIAEAIIKLKTVVEEAGIEVELIAAAKYLIDENFQVADDLLTLPGKHLLVKLSLTEEMKGLEEVIFNLQKSGYKIILTNPERYTYYHARKSHYKRLKALGLIFQLNLMSITGYYGKDVKHAADLLLEKNMYDLAGTESHDDGYFTLLLKNIVEGDMFKEIRKYHFKNKDWF
ncbi:tyrosine-protein phosphatase [Pedobacter sp. AW31-3R]|uniref:tyrosine-protein phosphatase n=1 Tax=Pedobacter sp. AW31-3R TaxID=3445781 RepID=UPI003F9FC4B4